MMRVPAQGSERTIRWRLAGIATPARYRRGERAMGSLAGGIPMRRRRAGVARVHGVGREGRALSSAGQRGCVARAGRRGRGVGAYAPRGHGTWSAKVGGLARWGRALGPRRMTCCPRVEGRFVATTPVGASRVGG